MDLRGLSLRSARLVLSSVTPEDDAACFAAVTSRLTRYMMFEPSASLAEHAALTPVWLAEMAAGTDLHVAIRLAETGAFLGRAGLHGIGGREPELGIWIAEAAQGRGFGREAVATLVAWAADKFGFESFRYPVVAVNDRSRSLAEALGGGVVGAAVLRKPGGVTLPEVVYRIPARPGVGDL